MSRHMLEPRDHSAREIVVGWDAHTDTFYALVIGHDSTILVERGDPGDRIFQPALVLDAIRPYADVPPGLDDQLLREALADTKRTS